MILILSHIKGLINFISNADKLHSLSASIVDLFKKSYLIISVYHIRI